MKIVLDFSNIDNLNDFHNLLREKLMLKNYHNNLDSLHDELASTFYELVIIIRNIEYLKKMFGVYIDTFQKLLIDIQTERMNIIVYYE